MSLSQKANQQAKDVIFSHILNRSAHPPLDFTSVNFSQSENQKYLVYYVNILLKCRSS